jgi:hypothetical protein
MWWYVLVDDPSQRFCVFLGKNGLQDGCFGGCSTHASRWFRGGEQRFSLFSGIGVFLGIVSFSDGNKRTGAFLFVDFLARNGWLLCHGQPVINDVGLGAGVAGGRVRLDTYRPLSWP